MIPETPPRQSGRDTFLAFMLLAVLGGMFVFFLNFVTFGLFFYVMAAVFGMATLGFLHYVIWGYDLSEEVAEERQRELLKQQQEIEERGF
jgi:hypothetical protein